MRPGRDKTFTCPHSGATYSCQLGTEGCMEPYNPACCLLGAGECPFPVHQARPIVGQQKTFTCPDGATYKCAPGSERGCIEPINEACCLLGAGECPFKVNRPPRPPTPPPSPGFNFEVCACASADACPIIVRACKATPENPLCAEALPFCNWATQEAENRTEGYVSNAPLRAGL
jgi:hypothetical protein